MKYNHFEKGAKISACVLLFFVIAKRKLVFHIIKNVLKIELSCRLRNNFEHLRFVYLNLAD